MNDDDLLGPVEWPEEKRRRGTPKRDLENAVKLECLALLAHLQQKGSVVIYERRNNLQMPTTDGGFIRAGMPGRADIWAVVIRRMGGPLDAEQVHIEIECKRRHGGTLSPVQKEFRAFCVGQRIPYFVVRADFELRKELIILGVSV